MLLLALGACARPAPASFAPPDSTRPPAREAWNTRFAISEAGRERAHVNAAYLAAYEGDSTYTLLRGDSTGSPVTVQLYDAQGQPSATVTAQRVVYVEAKRRLTASGNVQVQAQNGRSLQADQLVWDESSGRVRAPGAVRYASPTEQVSGYDLDADEALVNYSLRNITASVTLQ